MFRLFSRGKVRPGASADLYTLTFQLGDREAVFEIRASSAVNPLASGVLQDFRCPELNGT